LTGVFLAAHPADEGELRCCTGNSSRSRDCILCLVQSHQGEG